MTSNNRTIDDVHSIEIKVNNVCCPLKLPSYNYSVLNRADHIFSIIAIATFVTLLLPIFIGLPFNEDCDGEKCSAIFASIASSEFSTSLIASVAVSVPVTVDFILDIFSDLDFIHGGRVQRGVLLLSLLVPDSLILGLVIPNADAGMLVCIFHLRNALITYAVLKQLWEYGPHVFNFKAMIFIMSFFMAGHVLTCFSAFTSVYDRHLFYAFIACLFIAFSVFGVLVMKWLRQMFRIRIRRLYDLSSSDLNINVFLVPSCCLGLSYTILCIIYGGSISSQTPARFLSIFTYTEAAFTVAVFVLQGRLNRFQMKQAQQVRVITTTESRYYFILMLVIGFNRYEADICSVRVP